MSENLLKEWTIVAHGLLDNVYDPERIERLDKIILDLSKVRITDLTLYNIDGDEVTVRYKKRGSQTFKKISL